MRNDYVTCDCGEIAVNHGEALFCEARDWANFLRLTDEGNAINVIYKQKEGEKEKDSEVDNKEYTHKPSREEVLQALDDMIKSYEQLPQQAMLAPVTHADQLSLLLLVSSLFKAGNSS